MMNVTNISTLAPAPSPAPAPAPSSSAASTTNLLSNALSIACEIPIEETNIMSFLDLREFLMTACTVVVLLTLLNALQGTLTKSFNRINQLISSKKKRTPKETETSHSNKSKVVPTNNNEKEKSNEIQNAENTSNQNDDDDNIKTKLKDKAKDKANEKINEMMENTNTFFDGKKNEIKDKHGLGQVEIMIHIVQALCTIYSVVSYWHTYVPDLNGKDARVQILCRAAHLTIVPLFKPVSISMWPALMPLIQFLHWNLNKKKPLLNYSDRVLPGTQPFELNWLSFIYVYVVGFCWMVYMVLTYLELNYNNITDVQSIGEGLKTNNTLTRLELSNNNITDVQCIGEGLKSNNTLTRLDLSNNNITDDSGIQSIIDGLKTNNTLNHLDLMFNNQLSDNMKSQLNAIWQYKIDGSNGYQQVEGMMIHML